MKYLLDGQESARLRFRLLKADDYPFWLEFFKNPDAIRFWNYPSTDPDQLCQSWFLKTFERYALNTGGMNVLVDKESGHLVGQAGLCVQVVDDIPELEIGYSILPSFWKMGYASEAANRCREFAFAENLSDSLISIIHESNTPSQRVALKNGMALEKLTMYAGNPCLIFRAWKPKS